MKTDPNGCYIHINVLEEAVDYARPVLVRPLRNNLFEILAEGDDREEFDEVWEFVPGDIVRCEPRKNSDHPHETYLLAVEKVN